MCEFVRLESESDGGGVLYVNLDHVIAYTPKNKRLVYGKINCDGLFCETLTDDSALAFEMVLAAHPARAMGTL